MQAYICTFSDCETPSYLYETRAEWFTPRDADAPKRVVLQHRRSLTVYKQGRIHQTYAKLSLRLLFGESAERYASNVSTSIAKHGCDLPALHR